MGERHVRSSLPSVAGIGDSGSRSRWYAFRDRVGPLLETFHRQILEGAVTPA